MHAPWALAIGNRIRELTGLDAQIMHADDGIVLRIPDTDDDATVQPAIDAVFIAPDDVAQLVTDSLGNSALFASHRMCCPRCYSRDEDPGRRTPLWQQRQRSAALLTVASQYPSFPIVIETVRECLPGCPPTSPALKPHARRRVAASMWLTTTTAAPSPSHGPLLFSSQHSLYEGDSPLSAERRHSHWTPNFLPS